jgi:D-serine deaminase-like pyridoxal phosphate-dependent protein
MERPLFKPMGTPAAQLDTPTLAVDLDALSHNIDTVHAFFSQRRVQLRPHVSAHRCPVIARQQLSVNGTASGISVTTLGEADVFAAHGFTDVLIDNKMVTPPKIRRLCALSHHATLTVAVDHLQNIQNLSQAATASNTSLRVVVDVHTHPAQGERAAGQALIDLARAVCDAPHLDFVGLQSSLAAHIGDDITQTDATIQQRLQPLLEAQNQLQQTGINVDVVCVHGLPNYELVDDLPGITEVGIGAYALMDARHAALLPQLRQAAHVLTTVSSRPQPDTAITDAGQKAIGIDLGLPVVVGIAGATAARLSAEHCALQLEERTREKVSLGDKIRLTPWDIGTCVNLYDAIYAIRNDILEAIWPVAARGQYR